MYIYGHGGTGYQFNMERTCFVFKESNIRSRVHLPTAAQENNI